MDKEKLKQVLVDLRDAYKEEWEKVKNDVFQRFKEVREIVKSNEEIDFETAKKIYEKIEAANNLTKPFLLWVWTSPYSKSTEEGIENIRTKILNNPESRKTLIEAGKLHLSDVDNFKGQIETVLKNVKGVKIATYSSWLCIFNPKLFMPTWRNTINKRFRDVFNVSIFWGGEHNPEEFVEFTKTVKEIADKLGINSMIEVAFYLSKYSGNLEPPQDIVGIAGIIAWSNSGWKGFDKDGYRKRRNYGFRFVRETGIAHDWWNFYEGFDEKWYYGHIEWGRKAPTRFKKGLILFISRNIDDKKFYFVGFYGDAEVGEFNTKKKIHELLPKEYEEKLPEIISEVKTEDFREHLEMISRGEIEYKGNVRAAKEKSAIFREFIEVKPEDLGVERFGQWSFSYLSKDLTTKLLEKAKTLHERLLNSVEDEEERQEIQRTLRTIDEILRDLNAGKSGVSGENMNEELKEQIEKMDKVLSTKKQVILYGPPGTGKTWLARDYVYKTLPKYLPKYSILLKYNTEEQEKLENGEYVEFNVKKNGNPGKFDNLEAGDAAWIYNPSDKDENRGLIGLAICIEKKDKSATFSPYLLRKRPIITKEELGIISSKYSKPNFNYLVYEFDTDELKKLGEILIRKNVKLNYEFVTFHPSYAYEEFVEGLRPKTDREGKITYEVEEGIFKRICRNAYNALLRFAGVNKEWKEKEGLPELNVEGINKVKSVIGETPKSEEINNDKVPKFYLIIDEINRGDISRIFGELITLLEADKRLFAENELIVTLPYSKTRFGIPPNLYIIGTMNTADRSIALIDVALRRRFGFKELMPSYKVLFEKLGIGNVESEEEAVREIEKWSESDLRNDVKKLAVKALYTLNQKISLIYDRDHQIGHGYFLKLVDSSGNEMETLRRIWYNEVIPLLWEYFYNDWEKLRFLLCKGNDGFVREINLEKYADGELVSGDDAVIYEFVELQGDDFLNTLIEITKESKKSGEES